MREGRLLLLFEHINYLHFFLLLSSHFTHQHYVRVSRFAMVINRLFQKTSNIFQFFSSHTRVSFTGKSGLCKEKVGILRGLFVIEFRLDTQKHAGAHESACFSLRLDVIEVDASVTTPIKVREREYFSVVFFEHGWGC